MAKSQILLHI